MSFPKVYVITAVSLVVAIILYWLSEKVKAFAHGKRIIELASAILSTLSILTGITGAVTGSIVVYRIINPAEKPTPAPVAVPSGMTLADASSLTAERKFDSILVDLNKITAEVNVLSALITLKNTGTHDVLFKLFALHPPLSVDNNGTTNANNYSTTDMPICYSAVATCAQPDLTYSDWFKVNAGASRQFVLHETTDRALDGSTVDIQLSLVSAVPPAGGGSLKPTILSAGFLNVPLRDGATPSPILASKVYEGVSFDILSVARTNQYLRVTIAARDTRQRMASVKLLANPTPDAVDDTEEFKSALAEAIVATRSASARSRRRSSNAK